MSMTRGEANNLLLRALSAVERVEREVGGYDRLIATVKDAVACNGCTSANFMQPAEKPAQKSGGQRRGKQTKASSTTQDNAGPQGQLPNA